MYNTVLTNFLCKRKILRFTFTAVKKKTAREQLRYSDSK